MPPSILIVDDDEPTKRLLDLVFDGSVGYDILHSYQAGEALRTLSRVTPDLLMLDLRLPDMDGLSLLRRAREGGYQGQVLAFTAASTHDPLLQEMLSEIGSESLVRKPFDVDELIERVADAIESSAER